MDGMCLESLAHRDAIETRHVDVEEDEVRLLRRDRVERFDAVFGLAYVITKVVQAPLKKLAVRLLVVDDEDSRPAWREEVLGHSAATSAGW
jgi:hypothetical protein